MAPLNVSLKYQSDLVERHKLNCSKNSSTFVAAKILI